MTKYGFFYSKTLPFITDQPISVQLSCQFRGVPVHKSLRAHQMLQTVDYACQNNISC